MPRLAFASTLILAIAALPVAAHADPATPFPKPATAAPPPATPQAPAFQPTAPPPATPQAPAFQPAAPPPADAPAAPARPHVVRVKKETAPPLPDPALRVRVVAPSAKGMWTLHLENEGDRWLRVPADLRLLRFTIESGDTMSRRPARPVHCAVPQALRATAFPERNALLLGPGDSYTEHFDPRLFCFGKDAAAIAGGALVRVRYGWEEPKARTKKADPPFVVEGTTFPAVVEPKKELVGPSMVLSWLPPEDEDEPAAAEHDAAPTDKAEKTEKDDDGEPADPRHAKEHEAVTVGGDPPHPPAPPVDENAPRLELKGPAFIDASDAFHVTIGLTVTNVGHRPALAAIRPRMVGFRVDGPDGVMHCHAALPSNTLPREAFQTLKPGASTSLTLIVQEACDKDLFRRPGLYHLAPSLHLDEHSSDPSLVPMTGVVHAKEATLVRIADGPEPFYKSPPQPVRAAKGENAEDKPGGS